MGVVRLLDVGRLTIEQVVAMMQGADLSQLTGVWDRVEPTHTRRRTDGGT